MSDDLGNLGVCTRNALSKAISNRFMDKDGVGKWPTEFDGKSYYFQEAGTKNWFVAKNTAENGETTKL